MSGSRSRSRSRERSRHHSRHATKSRKQRSRSASSDIPNDRNRNRNDTRDYGHSKHSSRARDYERPHLNKESKYGQKNENVERWPNDKYFEMNRNNSDTSNNHRDRHREQNNFRDNDRRGGLGFLKPNKKSQDDDIMDSRRLQREEIGIEGVEMVWGKSPVRSNK